MKRLVSIFIALLVMTPARGAPDAAPDPQYERVIADVRESCGGIVERLNKIKTMAGINTVVTGVGTLAGGGALYAGISKNSIDKQAAELERQMDAIENMSDKEFLAFLKNTAEDQKSLEMYQNICSQKKALDEKSKRLGNVRTGLVAGNTATAVAGTVIANKNKNDGKTIVQHVSDCLAAVKKQAAPWARRELTAMNTDTQN